MKKLGTVIFILVILGSIFLTTGISGMRLNLRPVLPYNTMADDQVKKGVVICGYVRINLGFFAEEYTTTGEKTGDSAYYYVLPAGNKVMALRCRESDKKAELDAQAVQITKNPEIWCDIGKRNAAKVEQGVFIQGAVSEMNSSILEYMKEYLTPEGESDSIVEILPYIVDTSMVSTRINITYISAGMIILTLAAVFSYMLLKRIKYDEQRRF